MAMCCHADVGMHGEKLLVSALKGLITIMTSSYTLYLLIICQSKTEKYGHSEVKWPAS